MVIREGVFARRQKVLLVVWHMPYGINIHYAPKNSYSYYLLYERLSPARNSLFHTALIFIAANDFWVGITLQPLVHLTEGCQHHLGGALLLSHSTTDFQLFLALFLITFADPFLTTDSPLPSHLSHPTLSMFLLQKNVFIAVLGIITISNT